MLNSSHSSKPAKLRNPATSNQPQSRPATPQRRSEAAGLLETSKFFQVENFFGLENLEKWLIFYENFCSIKRKAIQYDRAIACKNSGHCIQSVARYPGSLYTNEALHDELSSSHIQPGLVDTFLSEVLERLEPCSRKCKTTDYIGFEKP